MIEMGTASCVDTWQPTESTYNYIYVRTYILYICMYIYTQVSMASIYKYLWLLICSKLDFHTSQVWVLAAHALQYIMCTEVTTTLEVYAITHSIEYDDDNDDEDERQDNGHNDDPHGNVCTWCGAERRYDGDGGLHGVTERRRECLRQTTHCAYLH